MTSVQLNRNRIFILLELNIAQLSCQAIRDDIAFFRDEKTACCDVLGKNYLKRESRIRRERLSGFLLLTSDLNSYFKMKLRHIGYACINTQLGVTTNRTFRLARLSEEAVFQTAEANFAALKQILDWNIENGIRLFRVGSSIIPYASHERFAYDWPDRLSVPIAEIRDMVRTHGLRLSMHPGQYTVLNSPEPKTVAASVREIEWQARLVSELDPEQGVMVLHIGGAYGDKPTAIRRFAENFHNLLSETARQRLVIENDDVTFTLNEVLFLNELTDTPVVFDILHHKVNHEGTRWQDGLTTQLRRVVDTWRGRVPKVHLSSPKEGSATSHADFITQDDYDELLYWMGQFKPDDYFDLMVEAKLKDQAVQALACESSGQSSAVGGQ